MKCVHCNSPHMLRSITLQAIYFIPLLLYLFVYFSVSQRYTPCTFFSDQVSEAICESMPIKLLDIMNFVKNNQESTLTGLRRSYNSCRVTCHKFKPPDFEYDIDSCLCGCVVMYVELSAYNCSYSCKCPNNQEWFPCISNLRDPISMVCELMESTAQVCPFWSTHFSKMMKEWT